MVRVENFVQVVNFTPNISAFVGLVVVALGLGAQIQTASPVTLSLFVAFASVCCEKLHPILTGSARFIAADFFSAIMVSSLGSLLIYFVAALILVSAARFIAGRGRKKRVFSRSN